MDNLKVVYNEQPVFAGVKDHNHLRIIEIGEYLRVPLKIFILIVQTPHSKSI